MKTSRTPLLIAVVVAVVALVAGVFVIRGAQEEPPTPATQLNCLGGSEKSSLMADPEVIAILRDKYSLAVQFDKRGSYDLVQIPTEQLRSQQVDCLWPSSASARSVFEQTHQVGDFAYRAESVLESPEVIYAGTDATDALVRAGIVAQREKSYYIVDLKRLLLEYVLPKKKWDTLGAQAAAGPIRVTSTDPKTSNSGFTLMQLQLAIVASGDVFTPPTPAEAKAGLPTIRALYETQGLQADSSEGGFREWLIQGAASLYAGYENQLLQQLVAYRGNESATEQVLTKTRMLYPDPTLFNSHPILALTDKSRALIDAMKDPAIQTIAWQRYGFRSGTQLGANLIGDYAQVPLAQQPRATPAPNADVTLLLLRCIRDNAC